MKYLYLLSFIFVTTAVGVRAADFGDISVKVEIVASGSVGTGYEEYRATIINRSTGAAHHVTLVTPSSRVRNSGILISDLRRSVEVAPSTTARISIFLPPIDLAGIDFLVIVDGQIQNNAVPVEADRSGAWVRRTGNKVYLLVSKSAAQSGLMTEPNVEQGLVDPSGNKDVAYLSYEFSLDEWSTNWLGYSKFDGIVLTAADLGSMPDGVKSALIRYMECGGSLLVIGSWDIPAQWKDRVGNVKPPPPPPEFDDKDAGKSNEKKSDEKIVSAKPALKPAGDDVKVYYIGFGTLIETGGVDPKQIDPSEWKIIRQIWGDSREDDSSVYSLSDLNRDFTIVDRYGVPLRGLFILMLVFVLVIGPINLLWLARKNRKIWLLWTVPAISLLTCLVVSAFSFLGEGLGATSRVESMTILDEVSHRATSIGRIAFYSPVTPSEGLHFSYDTELIPQLPYYWGRAGQSRAGRSIDWTNDQHLTFEWITARIPTFFKFRKSETRRERLVVRRGTDDDVIVVNGLGVNIRQLWWADANGNIYTATNIAAGAESALTTVNLKAAADAYGLHSAFANDWKFLFTHYETNPREALMRNSYLALIDNSPFIEEGLKGVKNRKDKSLVYGIQDR